MFKKYIITFILFITFKVLCSLGYSQAVGFTILDLTTSGSYSNILLMQNNVNNGVNLTASSIGTGASTQYIITGYRTITYTQESGSLVIPSTINGYPVIGFNSNTTLAGCPVTSITIPSSFQDALLSFTGCQYLNTINLPLSITTCPNLSNCPNLKNISLPISITNIPDYAFSGTGITSITIPPSVKSIGSYAFFGCANLNNVTIPNSVTTLGTNIFEGCNSLGTINLPSNLTTIGAGMFINCWGLNNVAIPSSVTTIESSAFKSCRSLTNLILNSGIKSIGNAAFSGTAIKSITIPSTVETIGDGAFGLCAALINVVIPSSVTNLGNYVFYNDTALTTVTLPDNLTQLGSSAFQNCPALTSINLPANLSMIDSSAFIGCTSLTNLSIPSKVSSIGISAFQGCASIQSIAIPSSVTTLGASAFQDCTSLINISIPNSVTYVGASAFQGCTNVATLSIGSGLGSISVSMFQNCSSLEYIKIPSTITSLQTNAFCGCSNLASVIIPTSVTQFGSSIFQNCSSLSSVYFLGNTPTALSGSSISAEFLNDNNLSTIYYPTGTNGWTSIFQAILTTSFPQTSYTLPLITNQLLISSINQGSSGSLSISATGTTPLSYQWYFNGKAIIGATSSSYNITSATNVNVGSYQVVVSNPAGSIISQAINLSINVVSKPTISTQPISQTISNGGSLSLSVSAANAISYQWQLNGSNINNATNSNLIINPVTFSNAGNYTVVVTNNVGSTTSSFATIVIAGAPTISTQPQSLTINSGTGTSISVSGAGPGLSYQWYYNGTIINGATNNTLSFPNIQSSNAGTYYVVITNAYGSVTSANATLQIIIPPLITSQPQSQSIAQGSTTTLSVISSGSSSNYQWYLNGAPIAGATSSSYIISSVSSTTIGSYTVKITNSAGSITSSAAIVTLNSTHLGNLSILCNISSNNPIFTTGFVVLGTGTETVLVRAIGPGLIPYVSSDTNVLQNPQLVITNSSGSQLAKISAWGGSATLINAFNSTGAFALNSNSNDSAVLIQLQPGSYTAQVTGINGNTGTVLVEVYEVTSP